MSHNYCRCDLPKFAYDGHNRCLRCGKPWGVLKTNRCRECDAPAGYHKLDCSAAPNPCITLYVDGDPR
ncbi:hypothetical protein LCGC14_2520090 [marine sediment metagenome]|uniref:Uncharacterized protein n=1 Tax=marine sediment metagenome TaxID=412755 RepID=A0A0F9D869_9ZZZZ